MKNKLYTLCDLRSVEIAESEITEFDKLCAQFEIKPEKGEVSNAVMRYSLASPINDAEARVIAGHQGHIGDYEHVLKCHPDFTPFRALSECGLTD